MPVTSHPIFTEENRTLDRCVYRMVGLSQEINTHRAPVMAFKKGEKRTADVPREYFLRAVITGRPDAKSKP
jgi:hypothetical protein